MNVVSLLIGCLLPLLSPDGRCQSPSPVCGDVLHVDANVTSVAIESARTAFLLDDQAGGSLGASLWDEEDSLEDDPGDAHLSLSEMWRKPGWGESTPRADSRRDPLGSHVYSHPLRC